MGEPVCGHKNHFAIIEMEDGSTREKFLIHNTSKEALQQEAEEECQPGEKLLKIDERWGTSNGCEV